MEIQRTRICPYFAPNGRSHMPGNVLKTVFKIRKNRNSNKSSKKRITKDKKDRESLYTFLLSSADIPSNSEYRKTTKRTQNDPERPIRLCLAFSLNDHLKKRKISAKRTCRKNHDKRFSL